jgi:AcrR family transcriptional regulator
MNVEARACVRVNYLVNYSPMPRDSTPRKTARKSPPPAFVRDAEASRARILDAATAEFAAFGLAGARVDRIADAADANKRMLYYYFGNKEALFLAVLERTYANIREAEGELRLLDLAPDVAIRRLVQFTWDYYLEHPQFITLLNNENLYHAEHLKRSARIRAMNSPVIATLRTLIKRGNDEGMFHATADPLDLYVSIAALSYFYLSNIATLSTVFSRDLTTAAARRKRVAHMQDMVIASLVVARTDAPRARRAV